MEEKVYRRQVQKQGLAQRVLDEQQVGRFFSQGDLKELYMFECENTPETEDDGGKRFKKPKDGVFADLLFQGNWARRISKYHEVILTRTSVQYLLKILARLVTGSHRKRRAEPGRTRRRLGRIRSRKNKRLQLPCPEPAR